MVLPVLDSVVVVVVIVVVIVIVCWLLRVALLLRFLRESLYGRTEFRIRWRATLDSRVKIGRAHV